MRSKFTTIRLKPDITTIDFEQLDKINEPTIMPETMETNSLTKLKNSGHIFSPLLAKTRNYQLPSVKEVPNEGEHDLIIEELFITKKENSPNNVIGNERKCQGLGQG